MRQNREITWDNATRPRIRYNSSSTRTPGLLLFAISQMSLSVSFRIFEESRISVTLAVSIDPSNDKDFSRTFLYTEGSWEESWNQGGS